MIIKGKGKIYKDELNNDTPFADVNYNIMGDEGRWNGELIMMRKDVVKDGQLFILELEDGRKGKCSLRKKVNKAVMGMPVRYFFALNGIGSLE